MAKIKVMAIIGTRPEAIKMAPIALELEKYEEDIELCLVLTAQHREMLDQVVELFGLRFKYDLGIMRPSQSLSQLTSRLVAALDEVVEIEKPQLALVQGDTTSTFVGGLVAFYHQIPVGHVEAGLRTGNKYQPFPEEINRRITSSVSELHFAPTETAAANLQQEGVDPQKIFVTGNTVIDALYYIKKRGMTFKNETLKHIDYAGKKVILLTAHRRENFGEGLDNICRAVNTLVEKYQQIAVVCPVHLNPRVQDPIRDQLSGKERIHLVEPLSYEDLVNLMGRCYLVLTDSGGIQEEAPALGKPVLVLRDVTERPEGVEAGTVTVVGPSYERIVRNAEILLTDSQRYQQMANAINPYGDGQAASSIVNHILEYFQK